MSFQMLMTLHSGLHLSSMNTVEDIQNIIVEIQKTSTFCKFVQYRVENHSSVEKPTNVYSVQRKDVVQTGRRQQHVTLSTLPA